MNPRKQRLILEQVDRRLKPYTALADLQAPEQGWLYTIRQALNMSLRQIASKLEVSPQGVRAFEQREKNGSITIKSLKDIAEVMDLKLVYILLPKNGSLEEMVKKKAMKLAMEIVNRTDQTMALEDQANRRERIIKAVDEKTNELISGMPKNLWD
jgi:predicted DNA-binding mobile mystery protein A